MKLKNNILLLFLFFLVLFAPIQSKAQEQNIMVCFDPQTTDDQEIIVYCYEFKDEYDTTKPIIKVNFYDEVTIIDKKLIRVGGLDDPTPNYQDLIQEQFDQYHERQIENIEGTNNYQPINLLSDGSYVFVIEGHNPNHILMNVRAFFRTNASMMNFWVHEPLHVPNIEKPDFAVSRTQIGNLIIETERPTEECRYTTLPISEPDLEYFFNGMNPDNSFLQVENETNLLIAEDFDFSAGQISNTYYNLRTLSVVCKEEVTGDEEHSRYSFGEIYYNHLSQPPSIEAYADPQELKDIRFRNSTMNISSNQPVTCVMSTPEPPVGEKPQIPYEPGTVFDDMYDFIKNQEHKLRFEMRPQKHEFEFNITCTNLAGLQTTIFRTINIDYKEGIEFIFEKPGKYVNTQQVLVRGGAPAILNTTNCYAYFNDDEVPTQPNLNNLGEIGGVITYQGTFSPNLDQGTNEVHVQCAGVETDGVETIFSKEFIFDTVPPTEPNITTTADDYTCSLSRIEAVLLSKDETSGIDYYEYEIEPVSSEFEDVFYINEISSSGIININQDLSSLEGEQIRIRARAFDKAGNEGSWRTKTLTVSNTSLIVCDVTPPKISIEPLFDEFLNKWKINVSCEDVHSGCKESFYWGFNNNISGSCNATQTHSLKNLVIVSQPNGVFCAEVSDLNNNKDYDSVILERPQDDPGCGDICGVEGCPKCNIGDDCQEDWQCITNYCFEGICTEATCIDGIHNGFETDVDCGGPNCPSCALGKMCDNDSDCESGSCEEGVCVEATCDDGKKSGDQTGVDCGGSCPPCGTGEGCDEDSDCKSGYCRNGVCASPPEPETKEGNIIGLILLILGVLLIITGGALLYFENENKKGFNNQTFKPSASLNAGIPRVSNLRDNNKIPNIKKLSPLEAADRKNVWNSSLEQKEKERKKILSAFGDSEKEDETNIEKAEQETQKEKDKQLRKEQPVEQEKPKEESKLDKDSKEESKEKPKEESKLDKDSKEEYIEIDKLKKQNNKDNSSDKEESKEDFFKKLKELAEKNNKKKKQRK